MKVSLKFKSSQENDAIKTEVEPRFLLRHSHPDHKGFLTRYTLNFIFYRSPSEANDTLYDPYLHFCYELALETSAKYSSIKFLSVHDFCHAHSLGSL